MDVKMTFLNEILEEKIYIDQSLDFKVEGNEYKVLKLKKSLYDFKEAPRAQTCRIEKYFPINISLKYPYEHALYVKINEDGDTLIVCLYVDDLILTENNSNMFEEFKKSVTREFEVTDIGLMSCYFSSKVEQKNDDIFVYQVNMHAKKLRWRIANLLAPLWIVVFNNSNMKMEKISIPHILRVLLEA